MGRELTLTAALLALLALWSGTGWAGQWVNPRDVIQDASLARLQQGRKELTPLEREEIEKYEVTGLEAMTYLDDNKDPGGQDYEVVERLIQLTFGKHLSIEEWINKKKYYFADHQALLARDGIRPGDVENKRIVVEIYPPAVRGMGVLVHRYLKGEDFPQAEDVWVWEPRLRRIRRYPETRRDDNCFGTEMTWDDYSFREPWEEEHRILGTDRLNGRECLVIESRSRYPNYYLARRVTWVEKENFIDLHEEQFGREGKLFKVIDREWQQVRPWGYWARSLWNFLTLKTGNRTIFQHYQYRFDNGFKDEEFSPEKMKEEKIPPVKALPLPQDPSDLPPAPQVRWEFWQRIGATLEVEQATPGVGEERGAPSTGFNPLRKRITRGLMEAFPNLEVKGHFYHFTDTLLHDNFNPSFDRKPSRSQNFGKVENWLQLKYKYHLTDHETLWGELAMLYDALYDLNRTHTDRRPDAQHDFEWWRSHKRWFKELFLESKRGPWGLRLGKQQVVWGKTDLFRILDKVNPQDQRELISDQMDWDFTRRATWMFNVEYGFSPHASLQLLWIPDFEPDLFAPVGSLNSPFTLFPLPAFLSLQKTDRPEDWGDSEYGVRLNFQNVQGFDFTLNYLYAWKKSPTFFVREVQFPVPTSSILPTLFVEPRHVRLHHIGGAVDKSLTLRGGNQWLFRLEMLYTLNDYWTTTAENARMLPLIEAPGRGFIPVSGRHPTLTDGVVKKDALTAMINAETYITLPFTGWQDVWFFAQLVNTRIFNWDHTLKKFTGGGSNRSDWTWDVVLQKGFFADRLMLMAGWAATDDGDNLYLASASWEFTDDLKGTLVFKAFDGHQDDILGMQRETQDLLRLKLEYHF